MAEGRGPGTVRRCGPAPMGRKERKWPFQREHRRPVCPLRRSHPSRCPSPTRTLRNTRLLAQLHEKAAGHGLVTSQAGAFLCSNCGKAASEKVMHARIGVAITWSVPCFLYRVQFNRWCYLNVRSSELTSRSKCLIRRSPVRVLSSATSHVDADSK